MSKYRIVTVPGTTDRFEADDDVSAVARARDILEAKRNVVQNLEYRRTITSVVERMDVPEDPEGWSIWRFVEDVTR